MIQQINLYQQGDTGHGHVLLNPYLLSVLGVCLVLLIAGGFASHTLHRRQAELQQLQAQAQQAQAQLQNFQSKYPHQQIDALLNQEIQQSQSLYHSLSHVLERLQEDQSDQTQGFSAYLSALAEHADNSVWLTGIKIDSTNNNIRLQGSTFKPEQIALLLQGLQHTAPFQGRHFARLHIQQAPDAGEQTDFSVSSSFEDETEAGSESKH